MTLTGLFPFWVKSTAKSTPSATSKNEPNPSLSSTLTGMSAQPKARPVTPTELSVASAMVEATWVPWKLSSLAWLDPLSTLKPGRKTVPPKSGALRNGPKSS